MAADGDTEVSEGALVIEAGVGERGALAGAVIGGAIASGAYGYYGGPPYGGYYPYGYYPAYVDYGWQAIQEPGAARFYRPYGYGGRPWGYW